MPDADQHVLEPMAPGRRVVHLVGDDRRQAGLLGQLGELRHEPVVVGLEVVRELHREVAIREVAAPSACAASRARVPLPGEQVARHLPVATAGEPDQVAVPLVERGLDQLPREDRVLLLPGEMATAGESRQGGVAGGIACQQDEVIAGDRAGVQLTGPATARPLPAKRIVELAPAASQAQLPFVARDGQLDPDDGGDRGEARGPGIIGPGLGGRLYETDRCIEAGVIGDGQRRHAQLRGPRDQLLGMAGTVEEAEVGVSVKLAVVGVRRTHRTSNDRTNVLICKSLDAAPSTVHTFELTR